MLRLYKNEIFHKSLRRIFFFASLFCLYNPFNFIERKRNLYFLKIVHVGINFIDYTKEMLLFVEEYIYPRQKKKK